MKVMIVYSLFLSTIICAQQWEYKGLSNQQIENILILKNKIIYAGSKSNFSESKPGYLFRSSNYGNTWDTVLFNVTVSDIDESPYSSDSIWVTCSPSYLSLATIYKTTNGGLSWFKSDSGITIKTYSGPSKMTIDPINSNNIYLGTSGIDGGNLYKSTNGGKYWTVLNGPTGFKDGISS